MNAIRCSQLSDYAMFDGEDDEDEDELLPLPLSAFSVASSLLLDPLGAELEDASAVVAAAVVLEVSVLRFCVRVVL